VAVSGSGEGYLHVNGGSSGHFGGLRRDALNVNSINGGEEMPCRVDDARKVSQARTIRYVQSIDDNSFDDNRPVDMSHYDRSADYSDDDSLVISQTGVSVMSSSDDYLSDDDISSTHENERSDGKREGSLAAKSRGGSHHSRGGLDDSATFSDTGSVDDIIEAKRARMEAIVTNMRVASPTRMVRPTGETTNGGRTDPRTGTRRQKRKQYTPKQHDVRANIEDDVDVPMKDGKVVESGALHQEVRHMQDQLAEIKQKYSKLLGFNGHHLPQSIQSRAATAGHLLESERHQNLSLRLQESAYNLVGRQLSQRWINSSDTAVVGGGGGGSQQLQQKSPQSGDTPNDMERLAQMLKAEIATGVGSLVDDIVKKFVEKHKLNQGLFTGIKYGSATSKFGAPAVVEPLEDASLHVYQDLGSSTEHNRPIDVQVGNEKRLPPHLFFEQTMMQQPSALVLSQSMRPPLAQMLTGFSDYSSLNRFACLPKSMKGKAKDPSFIDFNNAARHFNTTNLAGVSARPSLPLFAPHSFFSMHCPPFMSSISSTPIVVGGACKASEISTSGGVVTAGLCMKEPEQTEALPLIVSAPTKKKRTKVTDTRLSPRAARAILQDSFVTASSTPHHSSSTSGGHQHPVDRHSMIQQSPQKKHGTHSLLDRINIFHNKFNFCYN